MTIRPLSMTRCACSVRSREERYGFQGVALLLLLLLYAMLGMTDFAT